jgi:hypothetical protein
MAKALPQYEVTRIYIQNGTLTPKVYAEFAQWSGYSDSDLSGITSGDPTSPQFTTLQELLELYLNPTQAKKPMGSSCQGLVNKLAQIVGFLSAGAKLISELKNFSLSGLLSRINAWKDQLTNNLTILFKSCVYGHGFFYAQNSTMTGNRYELSCNSSKQRNTRYPC